MPPQEILTEIFKYFGLVYFVLFALVMIEDYFEDKKIDKIRKQLGRKPVCR